MLVLELSKLLGFILGLDPSKVKIKKIGNPWQLLSIVQFVNNSICVLMINADFMVDVDYAKYFPLYW